ncbi:YuzF family protein [Bacillus aerolatus]|nr:YuzF family protein [Bacillus aerolatus]
MALMTTAGRIEGINAGVAVDHIQMNLEDRSLHIRISQIVYFEGPLASYR